MFDTEVDDLAVVNLPKNGSDYKVKTLKDLGLTKIDAQLYFLNALNLYNLHKEFSFRNTGG